MNTIEKASKVEIAEAVGIEKYSGDPKCGVNYEFLIFNFELT
jgi:hypothetical protein